MVTSSAYLAPPAALVHELQLGEPPTQLSGSQRNQPSDFVGREWKQDGRRFDQTVSVHVESSAGEHAAQPDAIVMPADDRPALRDQRGSPVQIAQV